MSFFLRTFLGLVISLVCLGAPPVQGERERSLPPPEIPHQHQPADGEHVHPQPAAPEGKVGLEEQLGQYIPLDAVFRDEEGQAVTLGELIDGPTIIAPVYYRCPNVCSFLQTGLAQVLPKIALEPGEQFRVLSVSFDETDDPELARRSKNTYYTAMRGEFPPEAWRFLTGEPGEIRRLTDSLGYYFQRQGSDFLHPVAIAVVSPEGKIVRYLHGTRYVTMDLTLALVEGSEGKVGATIQRVLAFCFNYDAANQRYVFNLLRVSGVVVLATLGSFLAYLLLSGRKTGKHGRKS